MKLLVASYHTTKVIAHQVPKPVIANCVSNLVAMATSLSTYVFLRPIRAHNPNGIPIGSAVFAQTTVECPYTSQWDAHSPPKICPFPWGIWNRGVVYIGIYALPKSVPDQLFCALIAADVVRLLVYTTVVSCSFKLYPPKMHFLLRPC